MAEGNKSNKGIKGIPGPKGFNDGIRILLFWVILTMLAITLYNLFSGPKDRQMNIIYSQFREELNAGNISQVVFTGREVKGNFKSPKMEIKSGVRLDYPKFKTFLPIEDPNLIAELEARGVKIKAESTEPSPIISFLSTWGFIIVLGVLWFFFMRQMQGGQKGVFSFGKSKARLSQDKIKVTFSDVAGADEAKTDLREIIDFLKEPKKFTKLGGKIPKGALRRERAKPCWPGRWPGRPACLFSPSPARILWRCSWGWERPGCATCSSRASAAPPASSSSTRLTRWAATGEPGWAEATTSGSRP
jgi:hypothetical protein